MIRCFSTILHPNDIESIVTGYLTNAPTFDQHMKYVMECITQAESDLTQHVTEWTELHVLQMIYLQDIFNRLKKHKREHEEVLCVYDKKFNNIKDETFDEIRQSLMTKTELTAVETKVLGLVGRKSFWKRATTFSKKLWKNLKKLFRKLFRKC